MNLNIPFLRYTFLAFDEMKIKRICKIRFAKRFFIFIRKKKNIYVNI